MQKLHTRSFQKKRMIQTRKPPEGGNGGQAVERRRRPVKHQHERILDYIISSLLEKGYSPTTREIAAATGYASPATVNGYLWDMKADGIIDFADGISRTITVPGYAFQRVKRN